VNNNKINAIENIKAIKLLPRQTLQSHFTHLLQSNRIREMEKTMPLLQLQWWSAHTNDLSGKWKEATPRTKRYTVRSSYFRTALRFRMRLPVLCHHPGTRCTCTEKPTLHNFGLHLTTGCGKDGVRHQIHNTLILQLDHLLRHSSFYTTREERTLFRTGLVMVSSVRI
jgi:hypothetical protein